MKGERTHAPGVLVAVHELVTDATPDTRQPLNIKTNDHPGTTEVLTARAGKEMDRGDQEDTSPGELL